MKDKEVLKMLSKEELIKLIIEYQMPAFVNYLRGRMINGLKLELDIITDKQNKVDLDTLKGCKEYGDLQEEYERKLKVFNDLCGIRDEPNERKE